MSTHALTRLAVASMATCAVLLGASCHPNSEESGPETADACETSIPYNNTPPTSPATGALTLHGSFYPDETVILGYTDPVTGNPRTAFGTPTSTRTSFTLTGLPSGSRTFLLTLSCGDNGSHIIGSFTADVQ